MAEFSQVLDCLCHASLCIYEHHAASAGGLLLDLHDGRAGLGRKPYVGGVHRSTKYDSVHVLVEEPQHAFLLNNAIAGKDVALQRSGGRRLAFMSRVQPIFQNPFEAFNPLTPIDYYLFTTARRFRGARSGEEQRQLADQALQHVGLSLAEVSGRFSHELSGGQLQRIAVARAPSPDRS